MRKSVISITKLAAAVAAAVAVSACEAEKSRNPLSPNVAGPIAGVSISPPTPVNPINGAEVLNTAPVRLVFNNGSTNGERPLFYVVELASDAAFTNKVFAQSKVTPGSTQTSIVVDAALTADRTYYWRAKADDGANESEYLERRQVRHRRADRHRGPSSGVAGEWPGRLVDATGARGQQCWRPGPRRPRGVLVRGFPRPGVLEDHRPAGRRAQQRHADERADARAAVEHATLLARRGIQRHACGTMVADAELPHARGRPCTSPTCSRTRPGPGSTWTADSGCARLCQRRIVRSTRLLLRADRSNRRLSSRGLGERAPAQRTSGGPDGRSQGAIQCAVLWTHATNQQLGAGARKTLSPNGHAGCTRLLHLSGGRAQRRLGEPLGLEAVGRTAVCATSVPVTVATEREPRAIEPVRSQFLERLRFRCVRIAG